MSPKGNPGARQNLLLLAGSIVVTLGAAEIGVRLLFREEIDTEFLITLDQQLEIGAFVRPADDPRLLYELEPGVRTTWYGVTVVISDDGCCRVSPKPSPTRAGARKVALLGDSTAFGWRVEYDHAYGELFRRRLESLLGEPVDLRNFAVPGYNTLQHLVCWEEKVRDWSPDLVIVHYDHNDPDPTNTAPVDYIPPEYGDNPIGSALVKLVSRRLRVARNRSQRHFQEPDGEQARIVDGFRASGPFYETHLEELATLVRGAGETGTKVALLVYDSGLRAHERFEDDPHWTGLHEPLVPRLEELGAEVLDLYPHYQAQMRASGWPNLTPFWLAPVDGHPNRVGHRFIARALADFVVERELLSAGR